MDTCRVATKIILYIFKIRNNLFNFSIGFIQKVKWMQIIAQCPLCSDAWLLGPEAADRRIRCQSCNRLFKVPKLDEVPKAVKIINQAKGAIYVDQNGKIYG